MTQAGAAGAQDRRAQPVSRAPTARAVLSARSSQRCRFRLPLSPEHRHASGDGRPRRQPARRARLAVLLGLPRARAAFFTQLGAGLSEDVCITQRVRRPMAKKHQRSNRRANKGRRRSQPRPGQPVPIVIGDPDNLDCSRPICAAHAQAGVPLNVLGPTVSSSR